MIEMATAIDGLKYLRDFSKWVRDLRADSDVLTRVNSALEKVGEVQDKLQELREENIKLLEENRKLTESLRESQQANSKRDRYELFKTSGGTNVLKSDFHTHTTHVRAAQKKTRYTFSRICVLIQGSISAQVVNTSIR